jgi:hypothetical protein
MFVFVKKTWGTLWMTKIEIEPDNGLNWSYKIKTTEILEYEQTPEAGVLKKLSLAGIAKLSRLRFSCLRFVWPQPAVVDSVSTISRYTQSANSQLIPQSLMKYLGLVRLA